MRTAEHVRTQQKHVPDQKCCSRPEGGVACLNHIPAKVGPETLAAERGGGREQRISRETRTEGSGLSQFIKSNRFRFNSAQAKADHTSGSLQGIMAVLGFHATWTRTKNFARDSHHRIRIFEVHQVQSLSFQLSLSRRRHGLQEVMGIMALRATRLLWR